MEDGAIKAGAATVEFVVMFYGENILLMNGGKYLKHSGDKSVGMAASIDTACVWKYEDGKLQNVSAPSYYLQYNKNAPRFTNYTASQENVGLYVSSGTPKTPGMGANTFAQKFLHMRDYNSNLGYCSDSTHSYYLNAKAAYNNLSVDEKEAFETMEDAKARYEQWAEVNGDARPYDGNDVIVTPLFMPTGIFGVNESNSFEFILIISSIACVCIGILILKRKKENK